MPFKEPQKCRMCNLAFNPFTAPPHYTPIMRVGDEVCVIFPLCQCCWEESDEEQKRSHYFNMWIDWQEAGYPVQYVQITDNIEFILSSWAPIIKALNREINLEYYAKEANAMDSNQE